MHTLAVRCQGQEPGGPRGTEGGTGRSVESETETKIDRHRQRLTMYRQIDRSWGYTYRELVPELLHGKRVVRDFDKLKKQRCSFLG